MDIWFDSLILNMFLKKILKFFLYFFLRRTPQVGVIAAPMETAFWPIHDGISASKPIIALCDNNGYFLW